MAFRGATKLSELGNTKFNSALNNCVLLRIWRRHWIFCHFYLFALKSWDNFARKDFSHNCDWNVANKTMKIWGTSFTIIIYWLMNLIRNKFRTINDTIFYLDWLQIFSFLLSFNEIVAIDKVFNYWYRFSCNFQINCLWANNMVIVYSEF